METAIAQGRNMSAPPTTDEAQRKLCFDLFNAYWQDAFAKGVPFDTIGTMSISAALFALVAKHGKENYMMLIFSLMQFLVQTQMKMQKKKLLTSFQRMNC